MDFVVPLQLPTSERAIPHTHTTSTSGYKELSSEHIFHRYMRTLSKKSWQAEARLLRDYYVSWCLLILTNLAEAIGASFLPSIDGYMFIKGVYASLTILRT
ncbi:hypothetical protein YC2023_058486 [Brassica napus]